MPRKARSSIITNFSHVIVQGIDGKYSSYCKRKDKDDFKEINGQIPRPLDQFCLYYFYIDSKFDYDII